MDIKENFVHGDYIKRELQYSEVYYYLDRYMGMETFALPNLKWNPGIKQNHTIWILWLQGMEHAPKLIQRCYESVCRNKPEDYDIVLLTKENLEQYIQLPDYIMKKYIRGYITATHLSDIIRVELLCAYGGCWIDATVYCSRLIPSYMVSGEMFLFQASQMDDPVLKMSSWWMYAKKGNRILHATRKMLYDYWEKEDSIRNYFLLHIIMSKIVDEDSASKVIFRSIPYFNNSNPHVLGGKLGMEYDEMEWGIIKDASPVHKLTYKRKFLQGDVYNYYTALINGDLS